MKSDELRGKLQEIQELALRENIDIGADIDRLNRKLATGDEDAWRRVELARHQERPTTLELIRLMSERFIELHGDRNFGDDPALAGGIATIGGIHFTFLGHQKGRNMKENLRRNFGMAHPEGYRKALRLAQQAERFGRPVLTLIDTPGAFPGLAAEERGIGEAIARNLRDFSVLRTPIICVVIGEGGSGGALGIGVGDRVYMMENAVYSVISPEGFASILLRDAKKARQAAGLMKMTAPDLNRFGIIDGIIDEPGNGAHTDHHGTAMAIKYQVMQAYGELSRKRPDQLLDDRSARILSLGRFAGGSEPRPRGFLGRLFPRLNSLVGQPRRQSRGQVNDAGKLGNPGKGDDR
ncbi:MAG: acetyl-CoA carboxylase carboxyltransferase subunit alpha [Alkalispirochaeta sp.]|jgi:acetyl-CoA carboxylase carboxyl transferase subunit alpha